jgi:hypothetical protein
MIKNAPIPVISMGLPPDLLRMLTEERYYDSRTVQKRQSMEIDGRARSS